MNLSQLNNYKLKLGLFFWLSIPEITLRKILVESGFMEAPQQLPSIFPGVQVQVGPERVIATYKSLKATWNEAKFSLGFEGNANDLLEVLKTIASTFDKYHYPLDKVCHYYEVNLAPFPLETNAFVSKLRDEVTLELRVNNTVLKPFSISFSNVEEPISREYFYKWMHVIINPDVNASQRRIFVQIIKRETRFNEIVIFIENIPSIMESIKKLFSK